MKAVARRILTSERQLGLIIAYLPIHNSSAMVWLGGVLWRYLERGYRCLVIDAGRVCQILYVAAGPINCGVCAIAAFDDDRLDAVLGLDSESQFSIYVATVGKKRAK